MSGESCIMTRPSLLIITMPCGSTSVYRSAMWTNIKNNWSSYHLFKTLERMVHPYPLGVSGYTPSVQWLVLPLTQQTCESWWWQWQHFQVETLLILVPGHERNMACLSSNQTSFIAHNFQVLLSTTYFNIHLSTQPQALSRLHFLVGCLLNPVHTLTF